MLPSPHPFIRPPSDEHGSRLQLHRAPAEGVVGEGASRGEGASALVELGGGLTGMEKKYSSTPMSTTGLPFFTCGKAVRT